MRLDLAEMITEKEALDVEFERLRNKVRGVPWNPEFSYEEGRKAENYEIKWFKTWNKIQALERQIQATRKYLELGPGSLIPETNKKMGGLGF